MAKPGLSSVVVFVIRNAGRVLLLGPGEDGEWRFPSAEFDGKMNGGMDDTVRRLLSDVLAGGFAGTSDAKYEGSFVAKRGSAIEVVYSFSAEASDVRMAEPHMWADTGELEHARTDFRTSAALKHLSGSVL